MNDIDKLRAVMGTLPTKETKYDETKKVKFEKGAENITVELVDYNKNPYKAMYVLATSCWGDKINKWADTLPEHRFLVVKAVLERQALPLALEAPNFTFAIEGPSRAAFDQLARTRIGAVFSAKGMRDNNWLDCAIRIPSSLWPEVDQDCKSIFSDDTEKELIFNQIKELHSHSKRIYAKIVEQGKGSWQAARAVLPLYVVYGYSATYNYAALKNTCANRMKFCEMEDTCGTAWLMARAVFEKFPLLGSYLKPGCDVTKKCQYHSSYHLSEAFGCLFKECGRNPCDAIDGYAEFNEACTDKNLLAQQLGIDIPNPDEWKSFTIFNALQNSDKMLFLED